MHCYYRPNRSSTRHFDASAVARAIKCAREGGESCENLGREIRQALVDSGCTQDSCDCVRLKALTQLTGEIALWTAAAIAIWISRGRAAAGVAALEAPTIEGELVMLSIEEFRAIEASTAAWEASVLEMEQALAKMRYLGGELDAALLYSFAKTDEEGTVSIVDQIDELTPPEEE